MNQEQYDVMWELVTQMRRIADALEEGFKPKVQVQMQPFQISQEALAQLLNKETK